MQASQVIYKSTDQKKNIKHTSYATSYTKIEHFILLWVIQKPFIPG